MTALNVGQPLPGKPDNTEPVQHRPDVTAHILRYVVPVDGNWHTLRLSGPIVHVATRHLDVVEVWAPTDGDVIDLDVTVVGTGHPYSLGPGFDVTHVGTAITPGGELVWHLLQRGPNRPVD